MTTERRINALVVLLGVVLVVALRPVTADVTADGPTVECDIASFAVGEDHPAVTETCREAFKGRAAAGLIILAGIALLGSQLVRRGEDRPAIAEPDPPPRSPGEDPSVIGGIRNATRNPAFRITTGLGFALLAILMVVSRPVSVQDVAADASLQCGLGEQLFGAADASASATCRQAYAGRAVAVGLTLAALGIIVSMLVWIVQYHRGAALGTVWHRAGLSKAMLARVGGACATLTAVAIVAAGGSSAPAIASAAPGPEQPAVLDDAPLAEDLTPRPTFEAAPPIALPQGPSSVTPPATTRTTTTTTTTEPVPTPLAVRDASWFAANPTPLDAATVPEGSLPVGAVGGEDDIHAFFRVVGTSPTLTLIESDAPASQRLPDQAHVRACPVTVGWWEQTSGGAIEDEPAYDLAACVDAVREDDGTWTVDLVSFEDRGGARGFALIPAEDATTFRVTLQPQP